MKLPRFSLRLLLLAVAALCVWLAWERSAVLRRRAMLEQWAESDHVTIRKAGEQEWVRRKSLIAMSPPPPAWASVSWMRRQLGDTAIQEIWFDHTANAYEFERATWLFREASVVQTDRRP